VTGFVKTLHVCTRIQIHFIAYCNSHTCVLSRHNKKTGIDKQACFYGWPVVDPVKSRRTIIDPVRTLRGINTVAWVQFCPIVLLHGSLYGQGYCGHQSGPLCTQLGCLCLRTLLTHSLPYTWNSWYYRLFSKRLTNPASLTSSYVIYVY